VVLAAGLGTRLQPLTHFRAKPATPLLGRPLIHSPLELLARLGVQDCVINLHHLPDSVRSAVIESQGSLRIRYSHEREILGTAGALAPVRKHLRDRTVILANGKIHFEGSLEPALEFHRRHGSWVTLVLVPFEAGMPFNPVWRDSNKEVRSFISGPSNGEFPTAPAPGLEPYVFTGIHILDPRVVDLIPARPYETVMELYPRLMRSGKRILGFVSPGYWCETSTPQRYLEKTLELLGRREVGSIDLSGTGTELDRAVIGHRANLGEGCMIRNSVLWDRVSLGQETHVENSIIVDGSTVPARTTIRDSIVTPRRPRLEPLCHRAGGSLFDGYLSWPFASDPFDRLQSKQA
jgi:NDP-sugar pyrophosphorylase family protein